MMRKTAVLFAACLTALSVCGCGGKQEKEGGKRVVTLFVPCGMILPFDAARKAFQKTRPEIVLEIAYDTANVLLNRIEKRGEHPDIFVSPGTREIDYLVEKKLVNVADKKPIGRYQLMLFVPKKSKAKVAKLEDLLNPDVKLISLAEPEKNSVGFYVRQSLRKVGMWKKIQNKLIMTEHPIASYKLATRNKVQASFAYLKCPLESAPEKLKYSRVRIIAPLPPGTYDQPTVYASILATSKQKKDAMAFVDFLASPEGQRILDSKGMPRYWDDSGKAIKTPLKPPKGLLPTEQAPAKKPAGESKDGKAGK